MAARLSREGKHSSRTALSQLTPNGLRFQRKGSTLAWMENVAMEAIDFAMFAGVLCGLAAALIGGSVFARLAFSPPTPSRVRISHQRDD